jgi:hypothetical protein
MWDGGIVHLSRYALNRAKRVRQFPQPLAGEASAAMGD